MSDSNYPDVDFRTYDSLHTGFNQEKGSDTITLSYTFNDQEYEVNDGEDLHFTIPEKSIEKTNGLEPLWPYKYININDTKFVKNGAFGSNVPFFADKIKKKQGAKSIVKDLNGKRSTPNNGVYLCSWLYRKNAEHEPIWLDRYYYPDLIDREKALKGVSHYEQSFENILDKNYTKDDYIRTKIFKNTYVDKLSDMIIEPANSYIYHRLSSKMVNEVIDNLEPNRIKDIKNHKDKNDEILSIYGLDGEGFKKIDYKAWKNTNQINFNTDIYLSKNKRMGIQLFGSDYTNGFNIQNRKDLTPYHYYSTDETVYLLNNKFEIVHQFSLYEKYQDRIQKLILGDIFDDVVVITGIWMYILSYDLRLKSRIDLTAKDDESYAIKDLNALSTIRNGKKINLINYPYSDTNKSINKIVSNFGKIKKEKPSTENVKFVSRPRLILKKKVQRVSNSGVKLYSSNLATIMSESNGIFYKNNLYIPMDSKIIKIIFCPDC